MLAGRGGWFLFIASLTLIVGAFLIPYYTVVPALLGITLLSWFALEWVLFQTRSNAAVSCLQASRTILQGGREVPMVWAGLPFEVKLRVTNPGQVTVPFAVLEDRAAVAAAHVSGSSRLFTELKAGETVEIKYMLKFPAPGVLRFEGVRVRVADLQGFFYRRVFLRDAAEYLVLPPLTDDEGRQRATKHFNTLPAPGIHRLRRPGSGSELLDLRDYRPGDPPKMIAWKASARRDRLITKEFENDVPVRCVLFLDTSEGVRLGPPGNTLLTRLAGVAAVVSQAAAANRDLVGLTTVDENEAKAISPARTKIHMINVLRRLSEVSALQPGVTGVPAELLTQRAYPLAHELYPDLMDNRVNSMPLSRLWIPLLDRKWGWVVFAIIFSTILLFILGLLGFSTRFFVPEYLVDDGTPWPQVLRKVLGFAQEYLRHRINDAARRVPLNWPFYFRYPWLALMSLLIIFGPAVVCTVFWFIHSCRGWFGTRKKELTRRKQLSALFCLQEGTGVDGVERYVLDDEAYAVRVAAFLQQHLLRCPVPLYDESGCYRFRCVGKAQVLAEAMIRSVGRARDNELFVVLADLAELGADLAPVVKACRVARARHHHVLVIVPWPADVPSPDDPGAATAKAEVEEDGIGRKIDLPKRTTRDLREKKTFEAKQSRILKSVRDNLTRQYHERFRTLRRQLSKAGATVMRVNDGDPVQLVLERLDRLRGMRSRR